ncbi:MAG TPA: methylated-DNA--[protein]-cysteine S-methyltransferase [Desulfotignum sp.]|nr:methylated-DNA--[protein]-cysteine S-methyltransferase [Desulfotignum sp.]
MEYCYLDSPVGQLLIGGKGKLEFISFSKGKFRYMPQPDWVYSTQPFSDVLSQLAAYFRGKLTRFSLDTAPEGTEFQRRVWQALAKIPYGATISYGELAVQIGNPKACRAVGMANARNPIPIVIPCHRVIGKNGTLTGFGGGLDIKEKLLALERQAA